jgi:hypothetical protein
MSGSGTTGRTVAVTGDVMVDLPVVRKVKIKLLNGNCMPTKATESAAAFEVQRPLT